MLYISARFTPICKLLFASLSTGERFRERRASLSAKVRTRAHLCLFVSHLYHAMADEHPWISNRILRRLIDLSRGISALPPSTARGVCGHDRFRLLLDAESPSCADLLSALDNTWHGRPSFRDLPVQAIVVGEDGVGTLLTLLWKVGADELTKEEQENADSVDGRLLALFRAVDGRLNLEGCVTTIDRKSVV